MRGMEGEGKYEYGELREIMERRGWVWGGKGEDTRGGEVRDGKRGEIRRKQGKGGMMTPIKISIVATLCN